MGQRRGSCLAESTNCSLQLWDLAAYKKSRYDVQKAIRSAKRDFRDRVESDYHGFDPQRMWSSLCYITDYKERKSSDVSLSVSLPNELSTFYARFETGNTFPAVKLPANHDTCPLVLTTPEVSRAFKRVKKTCSQKNMR